MCYFFILSECAYTGQTRTAGFREKDGLNFYQLSEDSNPGRLGAKSERPPILNVLKVRGVTNDLHAKCPWARASYSATSVLLS